MMRGPVAVVVGFVRAVVLFALAIAVPVGSVVAPFVGWATGSPWSLTNPWTWIGWLIFFAAITLMAARPTATAVRRLAGRWSGLRIEDGYRGPGPEPVQLATGYWWNGHSYERTRRDAEMDQRWRRWISDPAYWRDVRWILIGAVTVGPVCAVPPAALVGAVVAVTRRSVVVAVVLLAVALVASPYAWRVLGPLAGRWLRPAEGPADGGDRVRELELQRAEMTRSQAAELRRIERDLHDGAQARLVAVGLSLVTAERLMDTDPERAKALLREAREGTSESLAGLRDLVRGVYPPVLAERGLVDAIRALALDSPLEVAVLSALDQRLEAPIEAAAYFSTAELLANAAKHGIAAEDPVATRQQRVGRVQVRIDRVDGTLVIVVEDNGSGGAVVVPGGGLDGIGRRLSVFDGTLDVDSPPGGPTRVRMEIPCG